MLRNLLEAGRSAGALIVQHGCNSSTALRQMAAAAPKMSLAQYQQGIRDQIAANYAARVEKYDAYMKGFEELLATSGLPRATDFNAVKTFHQKRADILKKVGLLDDWKLSSAESDQIIATLKGIPEEKKSGGPPSWYHSLSDAQVQECIKNPRLFLEMEKMHQFEDQFNAAASTLASKFDLPPVSLDALPKTVEPAGDYAISPKEVQWLSSKAKESAAALLKSEAKFTDPFISDSFKQAQKSAAMKLGVSDEQLASWQSKMTPSMWKEAASANGIYVP